MSRFIKYNANPDRIKVGDCTVRAICTAMDKPWEEIYLWLCIYGFLMKDMPSSNRVWGEFLKSRGYKRNTVDTDGYADYSVCDFCEDNPKGTFILALESHVICVKDGYYYDSWDSGDELPLFYWRGTL